jgi:hypothetical protein
MRPRIVAPSLNLAFAIMANTTTVNNLPFPHATSDTWRCPYSWSMASPLTNGPETGKDAAPACKATYKPAWRTAGDSITPAGHGETPPQARTLLPNPTARHFLRVNETDTGRPVGRRTFLLAVGQSAARKPSRYAICCEEPGSLTTDRARTC